MAWGVCPTHHARAASKIGGFTRSRAATCLARWLAEVNYRMWLYPLTSVTIEVPKVDETTLSLVMPEELDVRVVAVFRT
jgi:hypothetical protein